MNRWGIIVGLVGVLLMAFYFRQKNKSGDIHGDVMPERRVIVESKIASTPVPVATTIGSQVDETKPFKIPPPPEIERHVSALGPEVLGPIEKNKLMNYFQHLAPQFPEDECGQDLLIVTTFLEWHKRAGTDEAKLVETKMKALEANSREAILSMGIALQRMGHLFPAEKQYLLRLVDKLDVPEEEKVELLVSEAKRPLDDGEMSGQARFTPSTALSVLVTLYRGKEKHLELIVQDIVAAHKDHPEIQKMLQREYRRKAR